MDYGLRLYAVAGALTILGCGDDSSSGTAGDASGSASSTEGSATNATDDPSATSDPSSTDGTETGGAETDDSTGPADADACAAPLTAGPPRFSLNISELPVGDEPFVTYEADCAVAWTSTGNDILQTALECQGEEDLVHPTVFAVAEPPFGTPVWGEGDGVHLRAYIWDPSMTGGFVEGGPGAEGGGLEAAYAAITRLSDGSFLAAGGRGGPQLLAPLENEFAGQCGYVEGCSADPDQPMQALVSEPGGESVLLTGGRRAELPLSDGTVVIIDPQFYHASSDCHEGTRSLLAAWRVAP